MKLVPDGEQEAFLDSVRGVLKAHCALTELAAAEATESGLHEELWSTMISAGWQAMTVPESEGGLGTSIETTSIIVQEIGRYGCATPLVSGLQVGSLLSSLKGDERAKRLLNFLLLGDVVTYAGLFDSLVRLEREDNEYLLSADAVPVLWGHLAKAIVVVARDPHGTPSVHIVEVSDVNSLEVAKTLDNEPVGILNLTKFEVGEPLVVFKDQGALDDWLSPFRALQAALLTGCAQSLLEMTVEYVEVRKQFGRTLGSLPTVHQVLADIAIEVDGARLAVGEAATRLDRNLPASRVSSVASYWSGVVAQSAALRVAQLHGAIGFMKEFPLQLFFRRAKAGQLRLGSLRSQQDLLARGLLSTVMNSDASIAMYGVEVKQEV
jgi:alkylation response protein AidB-like acyl-CoA dehydrogenase